MVNDLAVAQVLCSDHGHFLICQREIPDVQILLHARHIDGLGDNGHATLGVPPQSYLHRALAVLLADRGQRFIVKDTKACDVRLINAVNIDLFTVKTFALNLCRLKPRIDGFYREDFYFAPR